MVIVGGTSVLSDKALAWSASTVPGGGIGRILRDLSEQQDHEASGGKQEGRGAFPLSRVRDLGRSLLYISVLCGWVCNHLDAIR